MKKKLIIIGIVLILISLIFGSIQWKRVQDKKKEEQLLFKEYIRQNRAFGMNNKAEYSGYHGYEEVDEKWLYVALAAYDDWNRKNNIERPEVTVEDIKEYLSDEFSVDGTVRIYSRPENIQEYIMWYLSGGEDDIQKYWAELGECLLDFYFEEHPEIVRRDKGRLNIEQLQELINKYNDPDYEINAEIMGETE